MHWRFSSTDPFELNLLITWVSKARKGSDDLTTAWLGFVIKSSANLSVPVSRLAKTITARNVTQPNCTVLHGALLG